MQIKYLERNGSDLNFSDRDFETFAVAELIIANEINRTNNKIIAIRSDKDTYNPDLSIYDRSTNKLLGYVECQGANNFKSFLEYKYPDFLSPERRLNKTYDLPTIFISWDLITSSYLLISMNKLQRAMEACSNWEYKDRMNGRVLMQESEKTYHLPLNIFSKCNGIAKLDDYFTKN